MHCNASSRPRNYAGFKFPHEMLESVSGLSQHFYSLLRARCWRLVRDIKLSAVTWTNGQGCGGNAVMTPAILMSIGRLVRWSVLRLPIQMGSAPLQTKLSADKIHLVWYMDQRAECKLSGRMFNSPRCSEIQTDKKRCFIFRLGLAVCW